MLSSKCKEIIKNTMFEIFTCDNDIREKCEMWKLGKAKTFDDFLSVNIEFLEKKFCDEKYFEYFKIFKTSDDEDEKYDAESELFRPICEMFPIIYSFHGDTYTKIQDKIIPQIIDALLYKILSKYKN